MEDLVSFDAYSSLQAVLAKLSGIRCFVTGHNGFVGSWLCHLLAGAGVKVTGFALEPAAGSLGACIGEVPGISCLVGDVRERHGLREALLASGAELVVHLAAQALVLPSYEDPLGTFATNVMGTANLLEAVRSAPTVRACVVVTSDKCYALSSSAHLESDPLGGEDPYSASKAAAELVTHAYRSSFKPAKGAVATTRAGNILGGGDEASGRLVPDWARALRSRRTLELRHPNAVRPWQHVLDATAGYVRLAAALLEEGVGFAEAWNFGPPAEAAVTVGELAHMLAEAGRARGLATTVTLNGDTGPFERALLSLDSAKATRRLGWQQVLDLDQTVEWTVEWYGASLKAGFDANAVTKTQVERYLDAEEALVGRSRESAR
jgi:CDP-glucose 4,6-dehydratase